ncbi:putative toxin-antitoxin system toxin component, PIN family [Pseudoduganella aquatica]|uniref:Putative toxin-antitoxin system toxin component, PIN family n=1 Tax=Pseudoduganella aquatica TaxID=2660641 RepID=A0A7X4KQM0_9BURK|nr:putative toxin-antitoxin system toxin component, PIN family [Pseudoduganella aquatica]MYN10436.1 putative toxin-antitoxin system toxin component, PIN family [Pseudoduganella aquatica]
MTQSDLRRIVFDTNVLVSAAILPVSVSRKALLHAVEHFQLVHSDQTWAEFTEVICRKKFDRYFPDLSRHEFLLVVARASEFLNVSTIVSDCRDPKDNRFLALAIDAGAAAIVSGDSDLLMLNPYRGIRVMSPSDFLGI